MKISRPDLKPSELNASAATAASRKGPASKQPVGQDGASDRVQLSSLSSHLSATQDGSPARVLKVNELGTAVTNGQYNVDAYAVSGSIIQHYIHLGGTGSLGLTS